MAEHALDMFYSTTPDLYHPLHFQENLRTASNQKQISGAKPHLHTPGWLCTSSGILTQPPIKCPHQGQRFEDWGHTTAGALLPGFHFTKVTVNLSKLSLFSNSQTQVLQEQLLNPDHEKDSAGSF